MLFKFGFSVNYSSGYWGVGVSGGKGFGVNLSFQASKTAITNTYTWEEVGKRVKANPYPILGLTQEDFKLSDKDLGVKLFNNYKSSMVDLVQKNIDATKQKIENLKQDIDKDKKQLAEMENSSGLFSGIMKLMTQNRIKANTDAIKENERVLKVLNETKENIENMKQNE